MNHHRDLEKNYDLMYSGGKLARSHISNRVLTAKAFQQNSGVQPLAGACGSSRPLQKYYLYFIPNKFKYQVNISVLRR